GIDLAAAQPAPPSGHAWRRWAIAACLVVGIGGGVVAGVLVLGNVTRRPEGAAERFLQAISSRDTKGIDRFGSEAIERSVFGERQPPKDFFRIEVGRASVGEPYHRVPFRVEVTKRKVDEGAFVVGPVDRTREW